MRRLVLACCAAAIAVGSYVIGAGDASAAPLSPACVVVDHAPLHLQVGYAPNGPSDCTIV